MGRPVEPSIDALYEQVRAVAPVAVGDATAVLTQVAPGIRVLALRTPTLPPAAHTNAYLVGPPGGPQFVVDPGSPYPDQQEALNEVVAQEAALGRPVAGIWLTHHHGDHMGGAAALAQRWEIPIAAHALTARRLEGILPIDVVVSDGDVIGGALALHTPGHADGHLCFEIDGGGTERVIIAGDMVAGIGTILVDPSEGDMTHYIASLERLLARPQATLCPAHGPPIVDGHRKLREYLAHRKMREDRVVATLAGIADASLTEMVCEVYADTPRVLWPLAERSLRAHLDKLVREGRVREVSAAPGEPIDRWSARG